MLAPGTGPFKTVRRVENEVWVLEKKKDYWNKGLPYLDGIEFYNLIPFSPELGAAILSHRVDYARVLDPVSERKAKARRECPPPVQPERDPGHLGEHAAASRSTIRGCGARSTWRWTGHVLIDVVKDVAPMQVGGFIYPFSEFATPKPELFQRVGYQTDPTAAEKEAKALMAAAGHKDGIKGLDFLIRDVASFKLWSQAMQAMLQQTLNVQCNLRVVVESVWFDDIANGHFDLAIGAVVSTLLDPSDYFNAWYRSGGPQNYSFWSNAKFDALADQIDREIDPAKRQALIRQAEAIFEQDPPVLPVAWEQLDRPLVQLRQGPQSVRILRRLRRLSARIRCGWTRPEQDNEKPTGKATTR